MEFSVLHGLYVAKHISTSIISFFDGYVRSSLLCGFFFSCRFLTVAASPAAQHRLKGIWPSAAAARGFWALEHRLKGCGPWTQTLHSMGDLPGPGIEPMSPTLAYMPPGKPPPTSIILLDGKIQ